MYHLIFREINPNFKTSRFVQYNIPFKDKQQYESLKRDGLLNAYIIAKIGVVYEGLKQNGKLNYEEVPFDEIDFSLFEPFNEDNMSVKQWLQHFTSSHYDLKTNGAAVMDIYNYLRVRTKSRSVEELTKLAIEITELAIEIADASN